MFSFAKSKVGLILLSSILSAVLFIGTFEIISNILYYRWKADFDNYGWFGKITIPSPNPVLMWEYRPYGENEGIKTNRYGFRDLDYESTAKPENTLRVAFAGDSVTLGMGVELEETFVRQFEIEAGQLELQYQVQALDFAVDGYNTPQIYEMIRTKVLGFSPDIVVYAMCMNDFDFTQASGDKILYFQKPKSFFLMTAEKAYRRLIGGDFHEYFFHKNKDEVFEKILEMRDLLEQEGVVFRVVLLPIFSGTFQNYPLEEMNKEIGVFLEENDIQYLDLLEAFEESGELPAYYAPGVWHPNVTGHRFIARQLAPWVLLDY
ncbi:MAG: SGNH/GDSL hydrolase family protein [Chloroflexi bacterium]|nr:SGNH/GDSL hydrolase family protein [Chloroflexota bacterium]